MKLPAPADLDLAAEWLAEYEDTLHGGIEDVKSCQRVALWLREQATDQRARALATELKLPYADVRAAIRRAEKQTASGDDAAT